MHIMQGSKLRGVSRHWSLLGKPWRARIHCLGRVSNTILLSSKYSVFHTSQICRSSLLFCYRLFILAILQLRIAQHICMIEQLYVFVVQMQLSIFLDNATTMMACPMAG